MNEPGFTPGPWEADDVFYQRDLRTWLNIRAPNVTGDLGEFFVAAVSSDPQHRETTAANARLIAAAPELYEAVETLVNHLNERIDDACKNNPESGPVFTGIVAAQDALAKARGHHD